MLVRPTPWGRGKPSWGPWTGFVRGMIVSFRMVGIWEIVYGNGFGDSDRQCMCSRDVA